jgi:hypothetical protein
MEKKELREMLQVNILMVEQTSITKIYSINSLEEEDHLEEAKEANNNSILTLDQAEEVNSISSSIKVDINNNKKL